MARCLINMLASYPYLGIRAVQLGRYDSIEYTDAKVVGIILGRPIEFAENRSAKFKALTVTQTGQKL